MKFEMFSEVKLRADIPEYNLPQGISAIIVNYCPKTSEQTRFAFTTNPGVNIHLNPDLARNSRPIGV